MTTLSSPADRLQALRQAMSDHGLDGWWQPSSDPHLSEYLPGYWQGREWLSGFTGSVGLLTVTQDSAGLWVDSRYWVQAAQQLEGSGIELKKWTPSEATAPMQWLAEHLPTGSTVGADGDVLALKTARRLKEVLGNHQLSLDTSRDLLSAIWTHRPALPDAPVTAYAGGWSNEPASARLADLRHAMKDVGAEVHFLSSLDDIAWLTQLRGSDVDYNPVFLAHMIVTADQATLFINSARLDGALTTALEQEGIAIAPYETAATAVAALDPHLPILLDPARVTLLLAGELSDDTPLIEQIQPTTRAKACKSENDLAHIRDTMEEDGVALCEFFGWLDEALAAGTEVTELTIDEVLTGERAKRPYFVSPSFPTIAGFNANGALPHYRATQEQHSSITGGDGLLLIDSGGQYLGGTTDITRMVPVGHVSTEQRDDVTRVLKGTIALSRIHFPRHIPAPQLDAIARAPLWQEGLDYGHGTGHGVGYFLNVHEGPQVISWQAGSDSTTAMEPGMITSIEPGLYREGQWGIRIENLVANRSSNPSDFGEFLYFETLTLCPIDTRLINPLLLNDDERTWLNTYHREVYERLSARRLSDRALTWLQQRTLPV
ncbi:aminopeptidase P family protein [Larsenimonas rhizosphaerae]|uniref:aminopeptidase P family protein n=1 Tax=Larsenimonas rhizosphaerae TaxID=2944682 RepID=UPI0020344741|nr:aminopeptidase P family protein [Larsenimonas rhizosphaerae]MCM2131357.1 aminopeptidase P family protein [Larsenimonas rhizosphaerae]